MENFIPADTLETKVPESADTYGSYSNGGSGKKTPVQREGIFQSNAAGQPSGAVLGGGS